MISTAEYLSVINEIYDLSDDDIRNELVLCNEAQKLSNVEHILNNLYNHIIDSTVDIDFGTIPKSRGNITKVENFQQLIDCIDNIHKLVVEYKDDTSIVDHISTAINNLQQRQRIFEKAFTMNIEFPVFMYNYVALSVVSATSLLISTCIEYVKDNHGSFSEAFDKAVYVKTKDHVLYKGIVSFNQMCQNKSLDKLMEACVKNNAVAESAVICEKFDLAKVASTLGNAAYDAGYTGKIVNTLRAGQIPFGKAIKNLGSFAKIVGYIGIGIAGLVLALHIIKMALYYFKYYKMKFSDWLTIQADYLQINAENLKYRDDRKDSDEHREKVYKRQMGIVDMFRKAANLFMIKDKKAQKQAQEEDERDRKEKPNTNQNDSDDGGLF